jgi:DNA-binding NarL/FixJ family response regulator
VITVAIADQELTFADALAIRLDTEDDIKVVAVAKASAGPVLGGCADIILLDADVARDTANLMGHANYSPETRVVMLSHTSEPERIAAAIQAGAAAWIRKDESVRHLLEVLRGVARGQTSLPAVETRNVLSPLLHQQESRSADESAPARLTRREQQVLDCLADGAGRSEVAARLHISANTLRTHLQNIMAKLGVHSTLEAIAIVRSRSQPHPGLPEQVRLTMDRTASLHQSVMQTAHALRSTAAEAAMLLEQRADLLEQPGNIDYPTRIKRWRVFADQVKQMTEQWESRSRPKMDRGFADPD